jgi:hypothetical protein
MISVVSIIGSNIQHFYDRFNMGRQMTRAAGVLTPDAKDDRITGYETEETVSQLVPTKKRQRPG